MPIQPQGQEMPHTTMTIFDLLGYTPDPEHSREVVELMAVDAAYKIYEDRRNVAMVFVHLETSEVEIFFDPPQVPDYTYGGSNDELDDLPPILQYQEYPVTPYYGPFHNTYQHM